MMFAQFDSAKRFFCAVAMACLPVLSQAQETRIPLNMAPATVEQLLAQGQFEAARTIALSAVSAKPTDPIFLISLARAEMRLGQFSDAARSGRLAWKHAASDNLRFAAARTVAIALFEDSNFTRAQFWLRRAREFAPDAANAEQIAREFRNVSAINPWSTNLRFSVSPSSNINNGSANATSFLFGFPFEAGLSGDARALSGLHVSAGIDTRYRIQASETAATFLTLSVSANAYSLSNSARRQAPNVKASDFSTEQLSYGINHRRILREGLRPTEFNLQVGRNWYGGDLSSSSIEGFVRHSWDLSPTDALTFSASRQKSTQYQLVRRANEPQTRRLVPSYTSAIAGQWTHTRDNQDRYSLGITLRESTSIAGDSEYTSVAYDVSYDFAKPFNGMRFGFGASTETRMYDYSVYAEGPREDTSATVRMSVNFAEIEYYGFQPVINVDARRNESSVALFDRDFMSVGLDLRSSF